jgi:phage shock protein A
MDRLDTSEAAAVMAALDQIARQLADLDERIGRMEADYANARRTVEAWGRKARMALSLAKRVV